MIKRLFTRRGALAVGAGTAVATVANLPALAHTPFTVEHNIDLMDNVRKSQPAFPGGEEKNHFFLDINQKLIDKYGADIFPEPKHYMSGPVAMFGDTVVEAWSRDLKAQYTFDMAYDGDYRIRQSLHDELTSIIAEEAYAEIKSERAKLAKAGYRYHPYVPVVMGVRSVDPDTLQPRVGFRTRYGISKV